jgi:hypothetical protein
LTKVSKDGKMNMKSYVAIFVIPVIAVLLSAIPAAMAQQSGYNLTVKITGHNFGVSVYVKITTEKGYNAGGWIRTAGKPSASFNVPTDQGNNVQVCVQNAIDLYTRSILGTNCQRFNTTGADMVVNMAAG